MKKLQTLPAVLLVKWHDFRFRFGRPAVAWLLAFAGRFYVLLGKRKVAASLFMTASRYSDSRHFRSLLRNHIDLLRDGAPQLLPKPERVSDLDGRCLVLSEPVIEEGEVRRKGVLLVSFTETSAKLYAEFGPRAICEKFHVVLEPSWSGYADPAILCWLNAADPIIVQTTERLDREGLSALGTNLVPVSFGAGDWIDAERFAPVTDEPARKYNAISVANFGSWKRNHAFITAVADARRRRPEYQAALVLAGLGKTPQAVKRLRDLITFYRVEGHLDLLEGLRHQDLRILFSHADALVFTSWKEGSSRVIFEAMCADCPVIVLRRNVGVNKDYINTHTGKLVSDRELGKEMAGFDRSTQSRSPRAWFLQNLGPENTTRKLVDELQHLFPREGWTDGDLAVKANVPEARYFRHTDRRRPLSAWLCVPQRVD